MEVRWLFGDWDLGWGREFTIYEAVNGPVVRFPESPPGFEARLIPTGGESFRLQGGPYSGAELRIDGPDRLTVGGLIPITRLDRPAQPPPGGGLVAPPLQPDDEELRSCERLWAVTDHPSVHLDLDLDGLSPLVFIQWLTANELVIFHGSNDPAIEELVPVRKSTELGDPTGRGNRGAVYGTHDGLWAMFFAVIDRGKLKGSIRNGVETHWSASGERVDIYHFSIHHALLTDRPFTAGAIYLLPRERFSRHPLYPGGPMSNEWGCDEPVRPLGRIPVCPEDFPFLDGIGGHDDGEVIEFDELADRIYQAVVSAREIEGGIEVVTTATRDEVERLVVMGRRLHPDVERTVAEDATGLTLKMVGPPGFGQTLRSRFSELLRA